MVCQSFSNSHGVPQSTFPAFTGWPRPWPEPPPHGLIYHYDALEHEARQAVTYYRVSLLSRDAHDPRPDEQVDRAAQRDANSCSSALSLHLSRSAFPFHPELHLNTHTMTSGKDAIRAVELLSPPCGQLCCLVRCSKDEITRQLHSFRLESHTHSIWPSWA